MDEQTETVMQIECGDYQMIYVVDDDPAIRNLARDVFSRAGYEVACFPDGLSLLAGMLNCTPAAIILDVHIPGRSGLARLCAAN